jgi:GPH family glycoside/pentoside/hexuronide:cation symporter
LWVWLCKKIGKKAAYIGGMSLTLVAVLSFAFFADKIGSIPALILMAFAGVGFASHYVAPWAIVPDTMEYGYAETGRRNEGVYYSVWTFVIALGGALAGFLVGQSLDFFGYIPNIAQTPQSIFGIRLTIGVLPGLLILAANIVLAFYPLTKKRYDQVLEKIKQKDALG